MTQVTFTGTISFPWGLLSAPVTYPAPTLSGMVDALARDLRDPDKQTFDESMLSDYVRLAFIEVGRIYPKEAVEYVLLVADSYQYGMTLEDIWRVEVYTASGTITSLGASNGEETGDGWEFYAGTLYLVDGTPFDADTDEDVGDYLRVWGYLPRYPPTDTDELCDVDGPAEAAIRVHAKMQAYRSLVSDRALFSQWAAQPGNTDVGMNQVIGMVDVFERQWQQQRRQLKLIRRVA